MEAKAEDIIRFIDIFYTLYTSVEGYELKDVSRRLELYKKLKEITHILKEHGVKAKFSIPELKNISKKGILFLLEEQFLDIVSPSDITWTLLRHLNK